MASTDQRDLRGALRYIREQAPEAVSAQFETSDQGSYGFVLMEVDLKDGTKLTEVNLEAFNALHDGIEQFINDISWDGVMDEEFNGWSTITVPDTFDELEAEEDDYLRDTLALVDSFNYARCENCGNDLNRHSIAPDPLGKPHLYCLSESPVQP